jgi:hypothetical protein
MATRGGEWSLKFLLKYLATVLKSSPKSKHTQERYVHEPTGGWVPLVMSKRHNGTIENPRKRAREEMEENRTSCTGSHCPG